MLCDDLHEFQEIESVGPEKGRRRGQEEDTGEEQQEPASPGGGGIGGGGGQDDRLSPCHLWEGLVGGREKGFHLGPDGLEPWDITGPTRALRGVYLCSQHLDFRHPGPKGPSPPDLF